MTSAVTKVTDAVGLTDSGAGDRAYGAQAAGMRASNKLQKEMYEDAKTRLSPWANEGFKGFQSLANLANNQGSFSNAMNPMRDHSGVFSMDDFEKDPAYEFRKKEGMKAINRAAAANGSLGSGGNMKALMRYGQDYASNEYDKARSRFNEDYTNSYNRFNADQSNAFNRLNTLANYGMNANNAIVNRGANMANVVGNNHTSLANAAAANEMQRGNSMKELWQMGMQMGGMMACWVARAIFGEENPKWKDARTYIMDLGPTWFKDLYLEHGEEFSKKVHKSKILKLALTPVFEYFAFRGRLERSKGVIYAV